MFNISGGQACKVNILKRRIVEPMKFAVLLVTIRSMNKQFSVVMLLAIFKYTKVSEPIERIWHGNF
jgi:hypothetical protein